MRLFIGAVMTAAVALTGLLPGTAAAEHPHERDGWTFGFNLGGGSAAIEFDGEASDREPGGGGNVRVGYCPGPNAAILLENSSWSEKVDDATWVLNLTSFAATYFPGGQGFYVRGGLGLGVISVEQDLGSGLTLESRDTGFGLLAAGGYEFRLLRTFSLGPQVEYVWMDVGDGITGNFVNLTAALNWYW